MTETVTVPRDPFAIVEETLQRLSAATPASTNSDTPERMASFMRAVAMTGLDALATTRADLARERERADKAEADCDEFYKIGYRDGREKAVQEIDEATGGDGEYCYVLGAEDVPGRHCPDEAAMKARIVARFEALQADRDALTAALADARERAAEDVRQLCERVLGESRITIGRDVLWLMERAVLADRTARPARLRSRQEPAR